MMKMAGLAGLLWLVAILLGCHHPVEFNYLPGHKAKAYWKNVQLKEVTGDDGISFSFGGGHYYDLQVPASIALKRTLEDRLERREEKGSPSIILTASNTRVLLRQNVLGFELGVAADFKLDDSKVAKVFRLEHTVSIPMNTVEAVQKIYARAVQDLCDQFFILPEAVKYLQAAATSTAATQIAASQPAASQPATSQPAASQPASSQIAASQPASIQPAAEPLVAEQPSSPRDIDSALLEPMPEVGPVISLSPSSKADYATGRILWGNGEGQIDMGAQLMLGDAKGLIAVFAERMSTNKFTAARLMGGFGGISTPGAGPNAESSTLFTILINVGMELGYRSTVYDQYGYVSSPGWSVMLVPQMNAMFMMKSDMSMNLATLGGALEFEAMLTKQLGICGSYFIGKSFGSMTIGDHAYDIPTTDWIKVPSGDLFWVTDTGRISLGLLFQQMAGASNGDYDPFANPTISLRFQGVWGRGIAYTKKEAKFGDYGTTKTENVAAPENIFYQPNAIAGGGQKK